MADDFRRENFLDLRGVNLPKGRDKDDKEYNRKVGFQPGYGELAKVVAGMGKEIKRINQCLTLNDATAYARKRKNWTAHEADITGPHGQPDGIKEVFVCDSKGNVKVINGYGLGKSDYPVRKAYRTLYTTKQERKDNPYTKFVGELNQIHGDFDENGYPYYERNAAEIGPEFAQIQQEITPKAMYKSFLFQPMYDSMKQAFKEGGVEPMKMARIYNKALSDAFSRHIKYPMLSQVLGGVDPDSVEPRIRNKALRSDEYKNLIRGSIFRILNNSDEFSHVQQEIEQLIGDTADEVINDRAVSDRVGERLESALENRRLPASPQRRVPA